MEEFFPWIFDGIGSELLSLLIGGIIGGSTINKLNYRQNINLSQKAKDNSQQISVGEINISGKNRCSKSEIE